MRFSAFAKLFGIALPKEKAARPPRAAPGPADAREFLALWDDGFDTREIAETTGFREAEVVAALTPLRDARRAAR